MKCPKCGNEQADGWLSCQKCHIIFARWNGEAAPVPRPPAAGQPIPAQPAAAAEPRRAPTMFENRPPEPSRSAATAPVAAAPRPSGWWAYLVLLLPFAAGLWWLVNPRGLAIEPGSFLDGREQFAIRAPAGWLTLTRENFDAIVLQYGSRFPGQFTQALGDANVAVSFVRFGPMAEFAPSMNVVLLNQALPAINEKSKLEAARAFAEGYKSVLAEYRQEMVRIIHVDKLRALEITSTAASPFRLPASGENTTLYLRYRQVLVPGKNRGFILTFTDTVDAGDESAADFQGALDSFRVLKRPARFGSIVNGGLFGGLLGGLLYALGGLLRALGGKRGN
jgi:hypothetical protein